MCDLGHYYAKLAVLFELRLTLKKSAKDKFTKEEILEILDQLTEEEQNSTKNH